MERLPVTYRGFAGLPAPRAVRRSTDGMRPMGMFDSAAIKRRDDVSERRAWWHASGGTTRRAGDAPCPPPDVWHRWRLADAT